jgi:branched-chain amino acid aminotransferase
VASQFPRYIWQNGRLVPGEQATVHVLSHALHYGSSVFEGVRVYRTPEGSRSFRLREHITRLFNSAKLYHIRVPYSPQEIEAACNEAVMANGLDDGAYIRPVVFRGYAGLGLTAPADSPVEVAIAAIRWGAYLGAEGLKNGVDVCVSSWQRVAPNTIPSGAKAAGGYLSSQLISMEAKRHGYAEGIGLTTDGMIGEGAGENIFIVKDGTIYTPPAACSILAGITRDTVITLARAAGYEVHEQPMPREMLYFADEVFFSGTAAEITPVRSVDRIQVSSGSRGPVTEALQERFFGLFSGTTKDEWGWLQPVEAQSAKPASTLASVAI